MTPFLEQVAQQIITQYSKNLDQICIVVPSQRAHSFLLSYLSKELKIAFIAPKIVTIDEFMSSISGLTPIDNTHLLLELFVLNQKINHSTDPDLVKFSGWAQQFLGDINEIDLHLADPKALFTTIADVKELALFGTQTVEYSPRQVAWLQFFKKLHVLYSEFNSALLIRHAGYQGLIYRYTAEHIHELMGSISYNKVLFCGFNALTPAEKKVINALLKEQKAALYWDADEYYLNDPMKDAGQFLRQNFIDFKLNKPSFISSDFASISKEIHLIAAQNNLAQAKFTGELLSKFSPKDLEKTVIVPADENLLVPLLNAIPIQQMNITMGLPIAYTKLYSFFLLLFDMQQNSQRSAELKPRYQNKIFVRDIVAIFEHAYTSDICAHFKIDSEELIVHLHHAKKVFLTLDEIEIIVSHPPLHEFTYALFSIWQAPADGLLCIKKILAFFANTLIPKEPNMGKIQTPEKLIFANGAIAISKVLKRLEEAIALFGDVIDVPTLKFLFDTEAHKETISFKGDAKVGLQLMGVLETRTLDFDHVIFLSANEGIIPSGKSTTSLIPFDVKRYFNIPSYQYKDAVFSYHFFRLLQRASTIYLLYNSGANDGKAERSRFVQQLLLELPKYNPNTKIFQHAIAVNAGINIKSDLSIEKTPAVIDVLKKIAHFSPSSLSKYINCSLQYYFSYVQKIKEPEELIDGIDDATLGNVIHGALEEIYTPFLNATIKINETHLQKIESNIIKQFKNPNNKIILSVDDLKFGKNKLVFEIAKRYIANVLNADAKQTSPMVLLLLEQELSYRFNIDNHPIEIFGKADRIDSLADETFRIIDYKTGNVDAKKLVVKNLGDLLTKTDYAKAFQLMMYALMYVRSTNTNHDICSGIISTRDKDGAFYPLMLEDSSVINAEAISNFETLLISLFEELFDPQIPFVQTSDITHCKYCDYKQICNKK